jgi:hypothetical protein
MSAATSSTFRHRLRVCFRWLRICALLAVLLALLGAFYLHQVGVPGFVRDEVTAALRRRGVELRFERLRLRWHQGLVAESVALEAGRSPAAPRIWFDQVVLDPQWPTLLGKRSVEINTLAVRGGQLVVPLASTNDPPEDFVVDQITARFDLATENTWRVDELTARLLDATVQARGAITNGFALWRRPRGTDRPATTPAGIEWRQWLRAVKRASGNFTFTSPPEIHLRFAGDARAPGSWSADLQTQSAGVDTPWGRWQSPQIAARWSPAGTNEVASAEWRVEVAAVTATWGTLRDLHVRAAARQPRGAGEEVRLDWSAYAGEFQRGGLRLGQPRITGGTRMDALTRDCLTTLDASAATVETPWARAARLELRGQVDHATILARPRQLTLHLNATDATVREVKAGQLVLDLEAQPAARAPEAGAAGSKLWRELAAVQGAVALQASRLTSPWLEVDYVLAGANWRYPELSLTNLQAGLLEGTLQLTRGRLDVLSREVAAELAVGFDVQRLDRLLPEKARRWLAQFQYPAPPQAAVFASVRLPPWGKFGPDLGRQVLPTLDLRARLDGRDASFRDLCGDTAGVTVTISNEVLRLRDLVVNRPEGRASLAYDLHLRTRDFRWRVDSDVDAHAAAPVIDDTLPPILGLFEFTTPPRVTGEVWGNWNPPKRVDFALQLAATNFAFRRERFDSLTAALGKTNEFLTATEVRLTRDDQWLEAPWVQYDLTNRIVALTNARTQMDPLLVARCIGPQVGETLRPYRFTRPPSVTTSGVVPAGGDLRNAAMTFEVTGGPFSFWRFNSTNVTAGVRWRGDFVSVTNVAAAFYGGRLSGGIDLELQPSGDATFHFQAQASEFDLQKLLRDVLPDSTNRVEGTTSVALIITDAQTADWQSWHGRGRAEMRDGLLWDLPIFGLLSKGMNLVVPGLGNSRASAARATFRIQRSVIYTDDLAIEAGPARLQYKGTVDFKGRVDARVVAEVLHGTPVIGPLVSLVLAPVAKVLEYKVTGTLADPELKPLRVPGFLRPLLNPLGTLQDIVAPPGETPPPKPTP